MSDNNTRTLHVGDKVHWRGAFGMQAEQTATVENIEVDCNGDKYGRSVQEVPWSEVTRDNVNVDLDTGTWAYGDQIRPL